jgi:lipopolysaccharide transport system permease protein
MSKENWTEIITPHKSLLDLKLNELWDYRDLIMIFVKRDIVATYKQTILGPLWLFLAPIFTVVVYTLVFNNIAKISTDNIPAPLFYLAGTSMWGYFQSCFLGTSSTFVSNANIFGKVYFPRLIAPISLIFSNFFKFCIQLLLFCCFWVYYTYTGAEIAINTTIILFPLLLILMGGIALGVGIIISSFTTKYRDLTYFLSFGITLLMYATPVIYPISAIPDMYKVIFQFNPIAPIIETFRYSVTGSGSFEWHGLIYSTGFMVVVLVFGIIIFNRVERTFMDTV